MRRATVLKPVPVTEPTLVYEDAVAEAIQIVSAYKQTVKAAANKDQHMRLGELAHGVTKEYGENRLKKFAKDVGVAACTLERCRSVYRAWMENPAPEPISYSVAKELQTHPNRFEIVRQNPNLTKSEAHEKMRELRMADADEWRLAEAKRWFARVLNLVRAVERAAAHQYDDATLREATDPKLRPDVMEGAKALLKTAEQLAGLSGEE
jgi:hypothetical protein